MPHAMIGLWSEKMKANIVIINGKCLSMEGEHIVYDWVAIGKDKILAVGKGDDYKQLLSTECKIIDAKGNSVLPGFIDSHFHFVQTALDKLCVDLSEAESFSDVRKLIQIQGEKNPEDMIHCIGLDAMKLKERRLPNRTELDKIWDSTPVWITSYEYQISVLNTCGMLYYKIPFTQDGVELDRKSLPTGIFSGNANALLRRSIISNYSDFRRMEASQNLIPELSRLGLTTVNVMEGGRMFSDRDAEFIFEQKKEFEKELDMVLYYQTYNIDKVISKGLKRIGGNLYVDGTFGSRTAAISFDYKDAPGQRGVLHFTQDRLDRLVENCYRRDIQLSLYTIGDRAIDLAINSHERAYNLTGKTNMRHRLEHAEMPTLENMKRASELGIIFSMQPQYDLYWGGQGKMYEERLGSRAKTLNPFRSLIDNGVLICGGSDSDTCAPDYIEAIYAAVNHSINEQSISVYEAIELFTSNGAYAICEETQKGYLKPTYLADIIILDRDLLSMDRQKLRDCRVSLTIKSGNIIYDSSQKSGGEKC